MSRIFLFLCLLVGVQVSAQTLRTTFSNDFSRWDFGGKTIRTTFSNDFGSWDANGIRIRTT
ncbi:hypothetical protein NK918_24350, partial [Salmonella enterica subsp. enterica serovar Typhimurium]|uniref:hypothetical protein n=1 Tax=Salmonella enterica TaxID=28901 RepID=UPI0020A5FD62